MTAKEALCWLEQRADSVGECDQCHKDRVALWQLPMEWDEPGEWMFCAACFRKIANKRGKP